MKTRFLFSPGSCFLNWVMSPTSALYYASINIRLYSTYESISLISEDSVRINDNFFGTLGNKRWILSTSNWRIGKCFICYGMVFQRYSPGVIWVRESNIKATLSRSDRSLYNYVSDLSVPNTTEHDSKTEIVYIKQINSLSAQELYISAHWYSNQTFRKIFINELTTMKWKDGFKVRKSDERSHRWLYGLQLRFKHKVPQCQVTNTYWKNDNKSIAM